MIGEEYAPEKCRNQDPSTMMQHKSQVHGVFLSIVVCDQIYGLKVIQEAVSERYITQYQPDDVFV